MLSFALAFHAVFHTCDPISDEFEECALHEAFGSFGDSFVTMFSSALGGPDFDLFDELGSGCRCNLPDGAQTAGIFLMVVSSLLKSEPAGVNRPAECTTRDLLPEKHTSTCSMNVLVYFGRWHRR